MIEKDFYMMKKRDKNEKIEDNKREKMRVEE